MSERVVGDKTCSAGVRACPLPDCMWLALGEPARTPALHKSRSRCTALIFTLPTWALLATILFFTQTMLPKRLLALTLFAALAVMPPCVLRAQWVEINGKGGASITCFAVSGNHIFAGTSDGIIVSTDSGLTWNVLDSGLGNNSNITALFANGPNVLAGTKDLYDYGGIYRLSNDGTHWEDDSEAFFSGEVYDFTMLGPFLYAISYQELAISSDMGATWKINDTTFRRFGGQSLTAISTLLFAGTYGGVIYSLDFGNTWLTLDSSALSGVSVISLATVGNDLWAGTEHNGIFRSTDDGATWIKATNGLPADFIRVPTLYVSGANLYAGTTSGIFLSTDSGTSWTAINTGLTNHNVQAIMSVGGILLAGTQGDGVFRSTDSGQHWTANNVGLTGDYVQTLFHSGTALFAGTEEEDNFYDGGVLRSTDEGENWESVSPDSATQDAFSFAFIDGTLFMGTFDQVGNGDAGLYSSSDNGTIWELRNNRLTTAEGITAIGNIGPLLFAGSFDVGLFLSSDTGANWSPIDSDLEKVQAVYSFADKGDTLFAATYSGIYRSADSGQLWERVDSGLTDTDIFCLAVVGNDIFAGDVDNQGPFRSTDNGTSWEEINNGLPFEALACNFAIIGTNIFAGTYDGIYLTTDFGNNWSSVSEGLPDGSYCTIGGNLTFDDTYLFVSLGNSNDSNNITTNGVWRRPLSDFGISSVAQTQATTPSEIQIYPNPFSQSTQITFTSQATGYAEVSIVNMLGVEVARLFSGELGAGEHNFSWSNPTDLPDGTYECLVRMNGQVETLPVVKK